MPRRLRKAVTSLVNKRWTKLSPRAPMSLFIRRRPHAALALPPMKHTGRTGQEAIGSPLSSMLHVKRGWL